MPDGSVWTISNYHQEFWHRYLQVFDTVEILARANPISVIPPKAKRVDRYPDITFTSLPFYIGPVQYLKKWFALRDKLKEVAGNSQAFILRVGSPIADILQPMLVSSRHPYAVEVVGDPYDTFSPGSIRSPFRAFYRFWFAHKLRKQTQHAVAASYVTSIRLPDRYPVPEGMKVYASSIELKAEHIAKAPRIYSKDQKSFNLISVGALEDWRKGPDLALKALKKIREQGHDVRLTWAGDGRSRPMIEAMTKELGLTEHVKFLGQLASGDAIFKELDNADLFILPTRGEGLPRAMIEAMARGLPATGSDVGGIPELISREYIHASEDHEALTQIILKLISDCSLLTECSQKNWTKSHDYLSQTLNERRLKLYTEVKRKTYEWQNSSSR